MVNQYIENYAEQGGVYYCYNYIANVTFQSDIFQRNKAVRISPSSALSNIYGGVLVCSGKNNHIILVNYCQFTSNFAEYEGKNYLFAIIYLILAAVYYSLSSTQITDTASVFISFYL